MISRFVLLLCILLTGLLAGCNVTTTTSTEMATATTAAPLPTPTTIPTATGAPPTATAPPATAVPSPAPTASPSPVSYTYRVINSYPHDSRAFTQGLVWHEGAFIEGTGLYGQSDLRRVELETGAVLQEVDLADTYFGEGLTVFDERIIQITWQVGTGFVYDAATFERQQTFTYATEGWGITHDGERLIVSDGSDTIYFWDPATWTTLESIQVFDADGPVVRMNELEYIDGLIYANIWQTERIAQIDPATGQVVGWIDLSGLLTPEEMRTLSDPVNAVLNGIAYDGENGRLFVTGKLWPRLFEIELVVSE